jgi:transposase
MGSDRTPPTDSTDTTEWWTARVPNRACLTGILFVLRSGIPWQMLPQELGCGSGMTCWRRLRDWQQEGIWDLLHFALLSWLARWRHRLVPRHRGQLLGARGVWWHAGRSESNRSRKAREQTSPDLRRARRATRRPPDRGESVRFPRSVAARRSIPPLQGERGRPRCRPDCVLGDRAYDAEVIRHGLRARHILPLLPVRRAKHGSGLGRWRWVVERTFAWLNQFRRLRIPYDKRADIHEAFLSIGCAWICWQSLRKGWVTG